VEQDILNFEEATAFLKTSKPTFYRWLHEGKVKGFKVGREWRFYKSDLITFIESTDKEKQELIKDLKTVNEHFKKRLMEKGIKPLEL